LPAVSTPPPGITSTAGRGASANENFGVTIRPIAVVTGALVSATVNTSNPAAPNISYGPLKSMICTPSNTRMATRLRVGASAALEPASTSDMPQAGQVPGCV
jgi:hypothetical protein